MLHRRWRETVPKSRKKKVFFIRDKTALISDKRPECYDLRQNERGWLYSLRIAVLTRSLHSGIAAQRLREQQSRGVLAIWRDSIEKSEKVGVYNSGFRP